MAVLAQAAVPPAHNISVLTGDRYRGAVVEDLQLPPAFSLPADETISRAIEFAYERDFSHIPVLDKNRRPLGYVDAAALKAKWQAGYAKPSDSVKQYMTRFIRNESHPYTVITPDTPLAELAEFLRSNIFALVTDSNRKFVLAVATSQDLEVELSFSLGNMIHVTLRLTLRVKEDTGYPRDLPAEGPISGVGLLLNQSVEIARMQN